MKKFLIHNSEGKILRFGHCLDSDFSLQELKHGESILEASYAPNKKVQNGTLVDDFPTNEELNAEASKELRAIRDKTLQTTDWTQFSDSPLSDSKKSEWNTYRQALRDLPTHSKWPNLESGDWPTVPS